MEPRLSRDSIVYEAIQRVYRPAVIRHIRAKMTTRYGDEGTRHLIAVFSDGGWKSVADASDLARAEGAVETPPDDEFDLLDVGGFPKVFETEFDHLFPGATGENRKTAQARKAGILRHAALVRAVRNPISHPVSAEIDIDDARMCIQAARRVVRQFDDAAADQLTELHRQLDGLPAGTTPLGAALPPIEAVGFDFVGRERELDELGHWLSNRDLRRWLLAGAGGRGKTSIAYEFARRVRDAAPESLTYVVWMSAKKRRFVEGELTDVLVTDFTNLRSAIERLLDATGWLKDAPNDLDGRRRYIINILREFPMFIVVDDIDSLEGHDEEVLEYFAEVAYTTRSKVLMTSRRPILGMGGSTTSVGGLNAGDGSRFINSRANLFGIDPDGISPQQRKRILDVTDGTPLFIEDLLRLTVTGVSLDKAISDWRARKGDKAREYALGRELDLLNQDARAVLLAASIPDAPVSIPELLLVTDMGAEDLDTAIAELQKLFLMPRPTLVEGVERFEVDRNTRQLALRVGADRFPDFFQKFQAAYQAIVAEGGRTAVRNRLVGQFVRQAVVLVKADRHDEAERTLLQGLEQFPEDYVLLGQLGWVCKVWKPVARLAEARAYFSRARDMGSRDAEMYRHWMEIERTEEQWSAAIAIGEDALDRVPGDQTLQYQLGYALLRFSEELAKQVSSRAPELARRAAENLEAAIVDPAQLPTGRARLTNSKAFRALAHALVDLMKYAGSDPAMEARVRALRARLTSVIERWSAEHPGDGYARYERDRLRRWHDAA
jgi:tetratricopeptide (TPR) repeat protein